MVSSLPKGNLRQMGQGSVGLGFKSNKDNLGALFRSPENVSLDSAGNGGAVPWGSGGLSVQQLVTGGKVFVVTERA